MIPKITIEEAKQFLPINNSFILEDLQPFLNQTYISFLQKFCKTEFEAYLAGLERNELSPSQILFWKALLFPLLNYAFYLALPQLAVQLSQMGLHLAETEGKKSINEKQLVNLQNVYKKQAYYGLNYLLEFLGKKQNHLFVRDAYELNKYVYTDNNHYLFYRSIQNFEYVQTEIIGGLLGKALYEEVLQQYQNGSLDKWNYPLVHEYIIPALCHLAWSVSLPELMADYDVKMSFNNFNPLGSPAEMGLPLSQTILNLTSILANRNGTKGEMYMQRLHKYLNKEVEWYPKFRYSENYIKDSEKRYEYRKGENDKIFYF